MYQKYNQHPELNRLIGAAAVSKRFRQMLLHNSEHILEHGYLGYQFDLTAEEATLINSTVAGTVQEFSLQLWDWMGRNDQGDGNGSQPTGKLPQTVQPFEDVLADIPFPTVPVSTEEEKKQAHCQIASQPTFISTFISLSRRKTMDPLILVVDDNLEMSEGLQFALEMEGFCVELASDGESAIKFLEHERPDLILADIKMPRMDGYALLHIVKQNPKWRDIPFIFVTAAADWREAVKAKSMGADKYIVKPFELEDLMRTVRELTHAVEKVEAGSVGESVWQVNRGQ